jgi:hypothetical protein
MAAVDGTNDLADASPFGGSELRLTWQPGCFRQPGFFSSTRADD